MHTEDEKDELTKKIIGCAFTVSNALGAGFLEKVYENALVHELRKQGLRVEQQKIITAQYDGVVVGDYIADLIVENQILIELKAAKGLDDVFVAICLNYLKVTKLRRCLLINFGKPKIEIRRISL